MCLYIYIYIYIRVILFYRCIRVKAACVAALNLWHARAAGAKRARSLIEGSQIVFSTRGFRVAGVFNLGFWCSCTRTTNRVHPELETRRSICGMRRSSHATHEWLIRSTVISTYGAELVARECRWGEARAVCPAPEPRIECTRNSKPGARCVALKP